MESKFYIGQKVVAIKDHTDKDFLKGEEFIVLDIKKACHCCVIKISTKEYLGFMTCSNCSFEKRYGFYYFNENMFAPIQEHEISEMTFEEAIELVSEKEKVI